MPPVAQLASRLTPRGWLIAGGGAVVAILFIYLFVHTVSQPSYTTLVSGVEPSQTGKMTSTLSAQGISYQLQNGGTALAVQANQTAKARVALAGADLLSNNQPGFQLFEKAKLGESNFQQQVTYQRALQGQLEETIDSVQGVSGAQVELVLPSAQDQIFGETQDNSSAAVSLSGTSSLDAGSVRGVAQLVASSVPGLQLSKVTITDASGALLWPTGSGGAGGSGGGEVQEAEQRYDQGMEASLDAMLAQTLGPGKAQVLVYANMNVNQATKEALEYAKTGTPVQQSKSTETLTGTGGTGAGGVTGTANLAATAAGGSGKSNFKHETTTSSLGVSKTVTHTTIAPGTVESQHVSVLLDKSVPASALPAIREAITNAAGIQTKRGDTISIGQVAFAKTATGAAASSPLGDAKYALLGLGGLLFLFFTTRSLRKREKETIEEPKWLRELEVPMRLSELERETATRPITITAAPQNSGGDEQEVEDEQAEKAVSVRRQVEQLADDDPERVAQQLRTWMHEG
ncbi:MAG TPA: flagellar basal-body MS-ring/collar protein FliF [Solirubrobacteraceae bacterium]|jgi:flagellar M-ring protein FliF|nr:flagellar basal-body MS-ring/collar protein FliF [Solirubrobacteraceae bacterium]